MKPFVIIHTVFLAVFTATTANARIGETISECTKRYGPAIFANDGDDLSMRVFNFSGKKISVYFSVNRSFVESIRNGPHKLRSHEQAAALGAESVTFFRGLLSGAYKFTEEELKPLADMRLKSQYEHEATLENESIRAIYNIQTELDETTATITMSIVDRKIMKENVTLEDFKKFMTESITLEYKAREAKKADGF